MLFVYSCVFTTSIVADRSEYISKLFSLNARLSEWSKEPDLRPGVVKRVGSNPTPCRPLVYGLNILSSPIV